MAQKILDKADKSIKTTESWWAFGKILWEEGGRLLPWLLGGAGLMGTALWSVFTWISAFGWAGWVLAFAGGFAVVCVLAALVLAVLWLWSAVRQTPSSEAEAGAIATQETPRSEEATIPFYSDDPEAEALDKQAYNQIVAFCVDVLLPACQAQIELQHAVVRRLCDNMIVRGLAEEGLRTSPTFNTGLFWEHCERLSSGLLASPGPSIKFEGILECIHVLESDAYKSFYESTLKLAKLTDVDPERDQRTSGAWNVWKAHHNSLWIAYEPIKRDIRFGKLHRLRRGRWGEPIDSSDPA